MNNVRQTIRGYTYDTTEAEFVASATSWDEDDLSFDVALYRTVDDWWFLVVSSDERTRSSVTPLTHAQARQWCQDHAVDATIVRFYFDARSLDAAAGLAGRPVAALLREKGLSI